jgi:hypothetical protein
VCAKLPLLKSSFSSATAPEKLIVFDGTVMNSARELIGV